MSPVGSCGRLRRKSSSDRTTPHFALPQANPCHGHSWRLRATDSRAAPSILCCRKHCRPANSPRQLKRPNWTTNPSPLKKSFLFTGTIPPTACRWWSARLQQKQQKPDCVSDSGTDWQAFAPDTWTAADPSVPLHPDQEPRPRQRQHPAPAAVIATQESAWCPWLGTSSRPPNHRNGALLSNGIQLLPQFFAGRQQTLENATPQSRPLDDTGARRLRENAEG